MITVVVNFSLICLGMELLEMILDQIDEQRTLNNIGKDMFSSSTVIAQQSQ